MITDTQSQRSASPTGLALHHSGEETIMRNAITTTPKTGQFAGILVSTNQEHEGIFTRRPDGTWMQHTGTGQTPKFRSSAHLAGWLRRHYADPTGAWRNPFTEAS